MNLYIKRERRRQSTATLLFIVLALFALGVALK